MATKNPGNRPGSGKKKTQEARPPRWASRRLHVSTVTARTQPQLTAHASLFPLIGGRQREEEATDGREMKTPDQRQKSRDPRQNPTCQEQLAASSSPFFPPDRNRKSLFHCLQHRGTPPSLVTPILNRRMPAGFLKMTPRRGFMTPRSYSAFRKKEAVVVGGVVGEEGLGCCSVPSLCT